MSGYNKRNPKKGIESQRGLRSPADADGCRVTTKEIPKRELRVS
jgi:hypothetical protein